MAPYPYPVGGTVQYVNMPVEIDEKTLTQIAGTTEGNYFRATSNSKLKEVYEEIDKLEKNKIECKRIQQASGRVPLVCVGCFLVCIAGGTVAQLYIEEDSVRGSFRYACTKIVNCKIVK